MSGKMYPCSFLTHVPAFFSCTITAVSVAGPFCVASCASQSQLFAGNFHTRSPAPCLTQKAIASDAPLQPWKDNYSVRKCEILREKKRMIKKRLRWYLTRILNLTPSFHPFFMSLLFRVTSAAQKPPSDIFKEARLSSHYCFLKGIVSRKRHSLSTQRFSFPTSTPQQQQHA